MINEKISNYWHLFHKKNPEFCNRGYSEVNDYLRIDELIEEKLMTNDTLKVLDVGCGYGRAISRIVNDYDRIKGYGVDLEFTNSVSENVNFLAADAANMPFSDEIFDIVYSYLLMIHLPIEKKNKTINEAIRILKSDGLLVFDDESSSTINYSTSIFNKASLIINKRIDMICSRITLRKL